MDGNTEQGHSIRDDSSSVHPKLRGKRKATDDPIGTCFILFRLRCVFEYNSR
ncbi:unnamed protein product [Brugia timori]|uniref:Uncharacterized protein n=1 Tax=Brugia timori TaxID=42155 RepID=A0A0R3Q8L5_9BILA|nr:unnamed protein product [Brugia timori]